MWATPSPVPPAPSPRPTSWASQRSAATGTAIHVDAEFAKGSMFGERIAHGLLGLSIASGLAVRLGFIEDTIIAFMGLDWKFRAPIKIGDTIHTRAQIAEKKPMPRLGGGLITLNVEVLNQRGETTQKGTWSMLMKMKPAS